jgi:hypothetical protein
VLWYGSLALIVVLGSLVIYTSRNARAERVNDPTPPRANKDHWHVAYAIDLCGLIVQPIAIDTDPLGIHTHKATNGEAGDGIIHVHPFSSASAGKKATLGVFADTVGLTITEDTLQGPGGKKYKNGDKCGTKPGLVRVKVDGKEVKGDPRKIHFSRDKMLITMAFEPADVTLPDPPSQANLSNLSDVAPAGTPEQIPATPGAPTSTPGSTPASTPGSTPASTPGSTPASTTASTGAPPPQ